MAVALTTDCLSTANGSNWRGQTPSVLVRGTGSTAELGNLVMTWAEDALVATNAGVTPPLGPW